MRRALLAITLLSACTEEDAPVGFFFELDGAAMSVFGGKEFSEDEIRAGIKPSPAIVEATDGLCPNAKFKAATSDINNPKRVNYYFTCDPI